jgi:16S rRNA (guanine527-N7)-methyltransferase
VPPPRPPPLVAAAVVDPPELVDDVVGLPELVHDVVGSPAFELLCRYRDILASRGIDWGLLGPREVERLWDRHIVNSLNVAELIPRGARVSDVGSGAGLPGIPVAVARPDLQVDLLEPLLRRSDFLTHTVDELGITDRVAVRRTRAEDVRSTYDVVVSRALAPLDRLMRWCRPLMRPTGQILAIKGASAQDEIVRHERLIAASGLTGEVRTASGDRRLEPNTVVRLTLS